MTATIPDVAALLRADPTGVVRALEAGIRERTAYDFARQIDLLKAALAEHVLAHDELSAAYGEQAMRATRLQRELAAATMEIAALKQELLAALDTAEPSDVTTVPCGEPEACDEHPL